MQKLIAVLLFILAVGVAGAESELKIENGELLVSPSKWSATGVKVTPEAQKYPRTAGEAFNNPGKLVITHTERVYRVTDLFHLGIDVISKSGVRYGAEQAVIDVVASNELVRTEVMVSPFPFVWLVSVVALFIFKGKNFVSAFAGAIAFVASVVAAALAATFSLVVVAITAFAAVFAAIMVFTCFKENTKKRASTAFYLLIVLSAGALYYPLF